MNIRTIAIAAAALTAAALIAGCGKTAPAPYKTPSGNVPATQQAAQAQQPAQAPAPPQFTAAQAQALDSALGYLTDGQGFSKAGLISQLHSPYGNGYSMRLARWAVDRLSSAHLWRQQAVISAKGYMADGQGFSYSSLVQQLDSPYGSQFTYAQAEYAARKAGL